MDGGYGPKGKDTLRTVLREGLAGLGRHRQTRIIETRCMGVCPKKSVTVLNPAQPGRLLIIPRGTSAKDALASFVATETEFQTDPNPTAMVD